MGSLPWLALLGLAIAPGAACAQMYRCEGPGGSPVYSDSPCGRFAKRIVPGSQPLEPGLAGKRRENPWTPLTVEHYDVRGSTPMQLRREISDKGPEAIRRPKTIGITQPELKYRISSRRTPEGCRIGDAAVSIETVILIPRWVNELDAAPELREQMREIVRGTERHEMTHVEIFRDGARDLLERLRALPAAPDCDSLFARASEQRASIVRIVNQRNRAFDEAERERKLAR
jgi:predicted secreted Zn-dependent protease